MSQPDCLYRISVKALILDEQKRFLLVKQIDDRWEFPGGGLDFGEGPRECLIREIKEEIGLEIISIADCPTYLLTALHRTGEWWMANVLYEVKVKDLNFQPSDECVEIRFFTKEEAKKVELLPNVVEFLKVCDLGRY